MAGPNLTMHGPINFAQSLSQKGPFSVAIPEKAGQTYVAGAPIQPYITGGQIFAQEWDGNTYAASIWGFAYPGAFGQNLPSNGAGAPSGFNPVGGSKSMQTFGSVPNQPNAVNIAVGAPATDGRTYFLPADGDTIFSGVFDNSTGTTSANYTPTSDLIGTNIGLTQDASGFWYPDGGVTGADAVLQIVGADPNEGFGAVNGTVFFIVLGSARYIPAYM